MLLPMRYLNLVTAALQPRRVPWTDWLVLLLACLASVYVFWDIQRPFHETDEFLYSQVVGQMLDSGDFVTPRFGSIDLLSKPPLFYWLSAIVQSLTGHEALGIRLLPGMSFILILFLIYRIGRERFSGTAGLLAALVFFLCYDHQFNHVYKAGVMEGILNLQIVLVFWLNLKLQEQPGRIRWIVAIIALAFMTKSVFAVIPAAITAANVWFRRGEIRITRTHLLQAVALCAAIVLPSLLVALQRHGIELVDYMFVDQVSNRAVYDEAAATETARTFGRTQSPCTYYIASWSTASRGACSSGRLCGIRCAFNLLAVAPRRSRFGCARSGSSASCCCFWHRVAAGVGRSPPRMSLPQS